MDHLLGDNIFRDRDRHPPRREIVGRIVLSMGGMTVAALAITTFAPSHVMLLIGGMVATIAVSALGLIALLLLFDTLLNEVWPRRRLLPRLPPFRHYLWLTSGLLHNLFAFLVLTEELSRSLGSFLLIFGWGCFLLTFVDAAHEKKAAGQCAP